MKPNITVNNSEKRFTLVEYLSVNESELKRKTHELEGSLLHIPGSDRVCMFIQGEAARFIIVYLDSGNRHATPKDFEENRKYLIDNGFDFFRGTVKLES